MQKQNKTKPFDKIQHFFYGKTSDQFRRELPPHKKSIYKKLTTNMILNGKRLNALALRPGTRQACLLSPLLFIIVLEIRARGIRQRTKKGTQFRKKKENFLCS